jgi:thioredoxin 1
LTAFLDLPPFYNNPAKYGVRNIPTVLVFQNGEVVGRQVGVSPKNVYTEAIDALL